MSLSSHTSGVVRCLFAASWLHSFVQITLSVETETRKSILKYSDRAPLPVACPCVSQMLRLQEGREKSSRPLGTLGPQVLCEGNTEPFAFRARDAFLKSSEFHA